MLTPVFIVAVKLFERRKPFYWYLQGLADTQQLIGQDYTPPWYNSSPNQSRIPQVSALHWNYFLSLERDFIRTLDYIELTQPNAGAFGNEYAKLLLLICSEIDVIAKLLCAQQNAQAKADNINHYQSVLTAAFQGIDTVKVEVPRYKRIIKPWQDWGSGPDSPPAWWSAHNKVKHQRDSYFKFANQENVLTSLCGLLALELYLHGSQSVPEPYPQLLDCGFPDNVVSGRKRTLPGLT